MRVRGALSPAALLLASAALAGPELLAAEGTPEPDTAASPDTAGTDGEEPPRRFTILPLPTLDYGPETGFAGGAVVLVTARPFEGARQASLEVEGTLTARRQRLLETDLLLFTPGDRWRIASAVDLLRFPEDLWGVGPDTPASAAERYDAGRVEVDLETLYNAWSALYLGPSWRLQSVYDLTAEPGGLLDSGAVTGAEGGLSSGLGWAAVWETRARPVTPAAGERYLALRQRWFTPALGSDFRFSSHELDGRAYLGLGPTLLALQGLVQLSAGDPPFRMMALLGGDSITRGYYLGRYRDRHLVAAQAELRAPLFWRLGAVAFLGAGDVAPSLGALTLSSLKPTAGGGLRLRLDDEEGTNLRVDVAAGRDALGVYFSFGEAF